jgi:foldase protein PrsA
MRNTGRPLRRLVWVTLLSAAVGLTGCTSAMPSGKVAASPNASDGKSDPAKDESAATIGGKTITRSELMDRLLSSYGANVLRDMMLHEAVQREAEKFGFTVTDKEMQQELKSMSDGYESQGQFYAEMKKQLGMDRNAVREDASYRLLLEKLATRDVHISDAETERYYKEHESEYGPHRQFELALIVTTTQEEANGILTQLEQGADFGTLAGQYSIDASTAQTGGYLGWVDEKDTFQDPKLLQSAAQLKEGEATGPIQTNAGYAVLELKGTKSTPRQELSVVQEDIRRQLAMEQAVPIHEMEQRLLEKYGAKVLDPRLSGADRP